jgi:hypothetical protein
MHDRGNSEIITGDVRESRRTVRRSPRRTKCPVTEPFPRSSLPHCTVRCHGNALHLYHDPSEGHSRPRVTQFNLATEAFRTGSSAEYEKVSNSKTGRGTDTPP